MTSFQVESLQGTSLLVHSAGVKGAWALRGSVLGVSRIQGSDSSSLQRCLMEGDVGNEDLLFVRLHSR